MAARLAAVARPGDRAALILPQGLDYAAAFPGRLLARVVAVPLFPPDLPGRRARVAAVLEDCEPAGSRSAWSAARGRPNCSNGSAAGT